MEKSFDKPKNLDGAVLIDELVAAGVEVKKDNKGRYEAPRLDGEGVLWLDIAESDYDAAKAVVTAHNG